MSERAETYQASAVMDATLSGTGTRRVATVLNDRARSVASQFATNAISPMVLGNTLRMVDFATVALTGFIAYWLYVLPTNRVEAYYIATIIGGAITTVAAFQAVDAYQVHTLRSILRQFGRLLAAWAGVFAAMTMIAFFARVSTDFSRVWLGLWFLGGFVAILALRVVVTNAVRRWGRDGRLERRAVIVGGGRAAEDLIRSIEAQGDTDVRICGFFDDRSDDRSPPMLAGYPKLGTIAELIEFGRLARIDMLIVSLPITAEDRVMQLLRKIWVLPVDIRLSAQSNKLRFRPRSYSYVGAVPFLDVFDKPIADWDAVTKRVFDVTLSLLGLLVFSPIFLATAIAIRLESKGPVLFRQKRFGFNNEVIEVLKFRSMFHEMSDAEAKTVVTKGDPRVTRVGRIIRKTSIDELPQLVNVLKGDLSLVGPRPHAVNAHTQNHLWDEMVDGYFGRHKVKPGVTGWAQINGWRGEVDTDEKIRRRVEHDLYYIENWSVLFDLWIVMLTPIRLLDTENAY